MDKAKVAEHWSKPTVDNNRVRWWQSPLIVRHVNERICGRPVDGIHGGDVELIRRVSCGRRFAEAVSVGCGNAHHELCLLEAGVAERFHLYELSQARADEALAKAAARGLSDRVRMTLGDPFQSPARQRYDLVFWKDALHHMPSALEAVQWSHDVLRRGGLFYMNDFVGPTAMQYTDRQLDLAAKVRKALDERHLVNPRDNTALLPIRRTRPDLQQLLATDPSECADSGNIITSVLAVFPQAAVIPLGGIAYMLALSDVLANIDEEAEAALLRTLMLADDLCASAGEYLYAVACAMRA